MAATDLFEARCHAVMAAAAKRWRAHPPALVATIVTRRSEQASIRAATASKVPVS